MNISLNAVTVSLPKRAPVIHGRSDAVIACMLNKTKQRLPVMPVKCATCPFRKEGWVEVKDFLIGRALVEATPVCHSTGPGALSKRVRKNDHACRGARDLQLQVFHGLGFIKAPTDRAWQDKMDELGL